MKKFFTFIRNLNWQQGLIIFLIISLAITYIFRVLTPNQIAPQPSVFTNLYDMETQLHNIVFSGKAPEIPAELPISTLVSYDENITDVKQRFINKFQLNEKDGPIEVWESDTYTTSILEDPFLIVLSKKSENVRQESEVGFNNNQITQITNQANTLIKELFPENTPVLYQKNMAYLTDSIEPEFTNNPQEAGMIYVPFTYQINGIPVYLEKELHYVAYFIYNTRLELVRAEIRPYELNFTAQRNYQTVPIDLAMSNVNNNNLALIYTEPYRALPTLTASEGDMSAAYVEYRVDPVSDTIAPYYRFTGTVSEGDFDYFVEIITPAIQTKFAAEEN